MTPELEALLKRIEAAGGPVEVDRFGMHYYLKQQYGRHRVGHDDIIDTALLIHALKLDTVARGARYRTTHEQGQHRVLLFDSTDVGHEIGAAWHQDNEVAAWCKAWLSAFEKATE